MTKLTEKGTYKDTHIRRKPPPQKPATLFCRQCRAEENKKESRFIRLVKKIIGPKH